MKGKEWRIRRIRQQLNAAEEALSLCRDDLRNDHWGFAVHRVHSALRELLSVADHISHLNGQSAGIKEGQNDEDAA